MEHLLFLVCQVVWLWDIVRHELRGDERRAFLKFFTGSDRAPIGGLGALRCLIQVRVIFLGILDIVVLQGGSGKGWVIQNRMTRCLNQAGRGEKGRS